MSPERRAVAFVLFLIALSVAARWLDRPKVEFPAAAALDLGAHEDAVRRAIAGSIRRPLAPGERLDPNTAPAAELERLPRVGPALAARIVSAREAAPFRQLADLRTVPGIGPALLEALAPHLALPEGAPVAAPAAAPVPARPAALPDPGPRPRTPSPATPPGRIAINHATAPDLETLPGIGPALAARIIAFRDSAGAFRTPADLEKVRGIGPALRARIEGLISFLP